MDGVGTLAEATSSRLNMADLGMEYEWEVEFDSEPGVDSFTKADVTIEVWHSQDDAVIQAIRRRRDVGAEPVADAVYEQVEYWLSGGQKGRSACAPWVLIKDGATGNPDEWTLEQFVDAIRDPHDRAFATRILDLYEANARQPRLGTHILTWFGMRPKGGIFPHPFALRYAPFQLVFNGSGELAISGMWKRYPEIKGHPGFAELAELLGLDETGPASKVPVAGLDPDEVWKVAESVARKINS